MELRTAGITPDIVTLGKPMGNGHPVAAVVARSEIVDHFAVDHEFFSTFGGNPVACAAALAVLDVIESEGLVANARPRSALVCASHPGPGWHPPAIGDVAGRGLMVGVDLVEDRTTAAGHWRLAGSGHERHARGQGPGQHHRPRGNVLKIRPPLVITAGEAAIIVEALDESLTAAGA